MTVTQGDLIIVQDWGTHPLREYTRTPDPASPVQTIISNSQSFAAPGNATENVYPGFASQLASGDLVVVGGSPGYDVVEIDATNTVSIYLSWTDLTTALTDLDLSATILNARIDTSDRFVFVYWNSSSQVRVARFNADKTLDLVETTGYDGSGPFYAAISPNGNHLAYMMVASMTFTNQYGAGTLSGKTVTFRSWEIGVGETTLKTLTDYDGDPYKTSDVNIDETAQAVGFAPNGDPLFIYASRTPPGAALVEGSNQFTSAIVPLGVHTFEYVVGTHPPEYDPSAGAGTFDSLESPVADWGVSGSTVTSMTIPRDAEYQIRLESQVSVDNTMNPGGPGTATVKLLINGVAVVTDSQTGHTALNNHDFVLDHTATLSAGDVISGTIENVDIDPGNGNGQLQCTGANLIIGATDGRFYTYTLERLGANPGTWTLWTEQGAGQPSIFTNSPPALSWPESLAPSGFPPYMASDSFDGNDTVWFWRGPWAAPGYAHNDVEKIVLPAGTLTAYVFENTGSVADNWTPIWVYVSQSGSRVWGQIIG